MSMLPQTCGTTNLSGIADMSALARTIAARTTAAQMRSDLEITGSEWTQVRRTTNGANVNNSTALVSDDVLKFTPAAGTVEVHAHIRYKCFNTTAGMRFNISNNPTMFGRFIRKSPASATATQNWILSSNPITTLNGVDIDLVEIFCSFDVTAQEYAFQHAQGAIQVGDNYILSGSFLRWRQVA